MPKQNEHDAETNAIKPGMQVEAEKGDLGEEDISRPVVSDVVHDRAGNVEKVIVKKGALFHKELDIPTSRVEAVEPSRRNAPGKVIVDLTETELEAQTKAGPAQIIEENDLLAQMEETIPTAEGVRGLEKSARLAHEAEPGAVPQPTPVRRGLFANPWLRLFGPGFLGGMAGNDSSAVTAYSIDGAQNYFGHLWLMLLSTPLYQSVMYTCAKLAQVTEKGLSDILREHYGRWIAAFAALILMVANLALIAADLVAIGSGFELITGIAWVWFVVPIAIILWYLTVYQSFDSIKRIFIVMSLAFLSYFVTVVFAHPDWYAVLVNTFVPHIDFGFASISSAVALLGATVSPYNIFWQVQGEKEEARSGNAKKKLRLASIDVGVGVFSGNLIAYFIIVCTAATLFTHHKNIVTAADAAQSLTLILGPFAKYLFAVGLIGAGLVAVPVLLAGTSYAIAGSFGWPYGLSKRPWQNEGFYLILTGALVISLIMALLHFDPIKLMFWANILSGILSPILVIFLIMLISNRKIMRGQRTGWLVYLGLIATFVVMTAAAGLLFYGIFTGQAS